MWPMQYSRIILVGGFCEPLWMLKPLQHALRGCCHSAVETWQDVIVFRDLEKSVRLLREELIRQQNRDVAIVSHRFGDWIVRQAIADLPDPPIRALVSVAPIMAASPFFKVLRCLGGSCVAEVPIMADVARSAANVSIDPRIRRLVLWARIDPWVRPYSLVPQANLHVRWCWATHLTIVWQPNVHRIIQAFLTADPDASATDQARPTDVQDAWADNSQAISSGSMGFTK